MLRVRAALLQDLGASPFNFRLSAIQLIPAVSVESSVRRRGLYAHRLFHHQLHGVATPFSHRNHAAGDPFHAWKWAQAQEIKL